ncbi:MAG: hypothetical protein R2771_15755 [Saprospiraceae bacterium]
MNRLIVYVFITFLFALVSCKNNDANKSELVQKKDTIEEVGMVSSNYQPIPDPCELVSKEKLSGIFNIPVESITIKSDQYSSEYSRSCNIKWDDGTQLRGLMILIQTNPLPDELDGWADLYLDTKREEGEKSLPDEDNSIKYSRFDMISENSAFNMDLRRLYWEINPDMIFAVFLSDNLPEKNIKDYFFSVYKAIDFKENN